MPALARSIQVAVSRRPGAALLIAIAIAACHSVKAASPGAPAAADAMAEMEPVAAVNGIEIPLQKFNELYRARAAASSTPGKLSPEAALSIKRSVAQQLIEDELVEQEARRRGVSIGQAQVDAALRELAASFPDRAVYERYLQRYPGGEKELREAARRTALRDALSGFDAQRPISEREARALFATTSPNADPRAFEQARPQIEHTLRLSRRSTAWAALLASLRASARIEDHLSARHPPPAAAGMSSVRELKPPPGATLKPGVGGTNQLAPAGPRG